MFEIMVEYIFPNTDKELKECFDIHSFDVFKFKGSIKEYNHDKLQILVNKIISDYIPFTAEIIRVQANGTCH